MIVEGHVPDDIHDCSAVAFTLGKIKRARS